MISLQSKNIKLRALEPEDLEILFQTENNTNLWEVSSTQIPFSKYILTQYIANSHQDIYEAKQLRLIIEYKNKVVGMLDLFNFEPQHKRAGIGIVILKKHQQKGLANKSLEIFIDYAFNVLDLHQIYANITTDNIKSIQLFSKQNFVLVGIKKDWIYTNKQYKDEGLYQLIKQ